MGKAHHASLLFGMLMRSPWLSGIYGEEIE
jgi:hypothetical protein